MSFPPSKRTYIDDLPTERHKTIAREGVAIGMSESKAAGRMSTVKSRSLQWLTLDARRKNIVWDRKKLYDLWVDSGFPNQKAFSEKTGIHLSTIAAMSRGDDWQVRKGMRVEAYGDDIFERDYQKYIRGEVDFEEDMSKQHVKTAMHLKALANNTDLDPNKRAEILLKFFKFTEPYYTGESKSDSTPLNEKEIEECRKYLFMLDIINDPGPRTILANSPAPSESQKSGT